MKGMFQKCDNVIQHVENLFCGVTLAVIVCISTAQVILRYLFGSGLLWGDEVNQALIVAMGMFGCAKAIRSNGHTELTLLTQKPKKAETRIAIRALINVISLAVLIVLFYAALIYTLSGTAKSTVLRVPRMYYYMSMPIGLGFSIYEFVRIIKTRIMTDPEEEY
ncbi:MAG: TRAP transporter small permease [Clostridiales bacterium]|nr:TRAP transporter small permease [Clostridiales bacterium]